MHDGSIIYQAGGLIRAITNNGGNVIGGGVTLFFDSSTAGGATLTCNDGAGGVGASVGFKVTATGGTARIKIFGNAEMEISEHNPPGLTTGSIEGSGDVFLGANTLTVGANNLNTTFSGILQGGGEGGGTGGLTWCRRKIEVGICPIYFQEIS